MKPKLKLKQDLPALADALGRKYEDGKKLQAEGGVKIDEAKEGVYKLLGTDQPKASLQGRVFRVGYFTRGGTPHFDEALFKDLYPKHYAKCLVTKTVFDEEMLKKLVKEKKIPEVAFNAAVVRPQGSRTIDIERIKQE